jgi:hypothetical protein
LINNLQRKTSISSRRLRKKSLDVPKTEQSSRPVSVKLPRHAAVIAVLPKASIQISVAGLFLLGSIPNKRWLRARPGSMPLEVDNDLCGTVEQERKLDRLPIGSVILLAISILGFAYIFWDTYRATMR